MLLHTLYYVRPPNVINFKILDAVLILYRFAITVSVVVRLCRRLQQTIKLKYKQYEKHKKLTHFNLIYRSDNGHNAHECSSNFFDSFFDFRLVISITINIYIIHVLNILVTLYFPRESHSLSLCFSVYLIFLMLIFNGILFIRAWFSMHRHTQSN